MPLIAYFCRDYQGEVWLLNILIWKSGAARIFNVSICMGLFILTFSLNKVKDVAS